MKLNNNDDSHNSGLNLLIYNMLLDIESHPAWVCGLKPFCQERTAPASVVTPCVGVWIETAIERLALVIEKVTPCVGVWIETSSTAELYICSTSHPAWVCGLKLVIGIRKQAVYLSHPAWVCGLKLLAL